MTEVVADRCTECGAVLTDGVCGSCTPTGIPPDKGERRHREANAAHEKELWDQHALVRKHRDRGPVVRP
jgi:hypothetical protein